MVKIAVVKGNAYEATIKALELTDFKKLVEKKSNIVIKPNLTNFLKAKDGITTDVNIVRAILDQIPKPENVIVAEGPGGADAKHAFRFNGYYELEKDYGLRLLDVNNDEYVEIPVDDPLILRSIKISKTVFNSNFLISVGKLKIHSIAKVTGALKNMMGACPRQQKFKIHSFIPNSLVDLISIKNPDFGVIDGIVANEIDECVPHPVKMGIILASKDCIALDTISSEIMGIKALEVPYITEIARRGFGVANMDEINIDGEKIENVRRIFRRGGFNFISNSQRVISRILFRLGLLDQYFRLVYKFFR